MNNNYNEVALKDAIKKAFEEGTCIETEGFKIGFYTNAEDVFETRCFGVERNGKRIELNSEDVDIFTDEVCWPTLYLSEAMEYIAEEFGDA